VSLGVVGDVFEVMVQVDRRLTKVNLVDRIIRVNKPAENLGRHRKKGGEKLLYIPRAYSKSQGGACAFLLHF
jgi:hypothetical protein